MKYFIFNNEREGTIYHEFYKGKWDGATFWRDDSIFLRDDVLIDHQGLYNALCEGIAEYDPNGMIVVSYEDWEKVKTFIPEDDAESLEIYEEADAWVQESIDEFGCFSILGL